MVFFGFVLQNHMFKYIEASKKYIEKCVYVCMNFMFQAAFLLSWWHLQEQVDNDDCKRCKVASQERNKFGDYKLCGIF